MVFVIWLLGRVLLVLGKQVIEKNKAPKVLPAVIAAALLFAAQTSSAQDAAQAKLLTWYQITADFLHHFLHAVIRAHN